MSRVRILLAALLAVSTLAVLAIPASASVPSANARFCNAAKKIGNDADNASAFSANRARQLQSQFKAAAKSAPPKVKKAVANITKLLGLIAGTTNPADLPRVYTSDAFRKYPNAVTTFFTYQATECAGT